MSTRVFEEVLLAPACQHQRSHSPRGNTFRVQAGQNRPLMTRSPDHDAPPRTRLTHSNGVFRDLETHALTVPAHLAACKQVVVQVHFAALIGDEVQPLFHQPGEQLAIVATAIEDDCKVLIAHHLPHGSDHARQALGQIAADLFGHHQQWPAAQIVDEILHDAWQWHPPVRIPHLRHQSRAVVDLDVAVDVQVARIHQADLEPVASEQCSQVHRLALLGELVQLATQRLDAGRLPTAHDRPKITAQHMFDALNARLLQQRQTKQFGEDQLDSKAQRASQLVDLRRQLK